MKPHNTFTISLQLQRPMATRWGACTLTLQKPMPSTQNSSNGLILRVLDRNSLHPTPSIKMASSKDTYRPSKIWFLPPSTPLECQKDFGEKQLYGQKPPGMRSHAWITKESCHIWLSLDNKWTCLFFTHLDVRHLPTFHLWWSEFVQLLNQAGDFKFLSDLNKMWCSLITFSPDEWTKTLHPCPLQVFKWRLVVQNNPQNSTTSIAPITSPLTLPPQAPMDPADPVTPPLVLPDVTLQAGPSEIYYP